MFVLDARLAEALDALVEELEGQVGLVLSQLLAHGLDEDGVVGRDAQTCRRAKIGQRNAKGTPAVSTVKSR